MTRKRFVKLLMSSGMSRNHANAYARRAVEQGTDIFIRQDEELAEKCLTGLANRWGVEEGQQK